MDNVQRSKHIYLFVSSLECHNCGTIWEAKEHKEKNNGLGVQANSGSKTYALVCVLVITNSLANFSELHQFPCL